MLISDETANKAATSLQQPPIFTSSQPLPRLSQPTLYSRRPLTASVKKAVRVKVRLLKSFCTVRKSGQPVPQAAICFHTYISDVLQTLSPTSYSNHHIQKMDGISQLTLNELCTSVSSKSMTTQIFPASQDSISGSRALIGAWTKKIKTRDTFNSFTDQIVCLTPAVPACCFI